MSESIKELDDTQVLAFDTEYVTEELWESLINELNRLEFTKSDFSFLDIGGGNGQFTDRLLNHFPNSQGYLLDNSKFLLDKNQEHPRKSLIESSAENLPDILEDNNKFEIIFLNWMLHHCVLDSFTKTKKCQREILKKAMMALKDTGRIVVFENLPQGLLGETLCSYMINRVTSSKTIAPFVKKMGGNTAGIGIGFLGEKQWQKQFALAGLTIENFKLFNEWKLNLIKKYLLTIKDMRVGLYVLKKTSQCLPII